MAKFTDCYLYVNNIYYYLCDLYGKENINLKRLMCVIYFFDLNWLNKVGTPYIWEDYILFNNEDFFNSIPIGAFDADYFAITDHDIIDELVKLYPVASDLDKLTYVSRINHKVEIVKYVNNNTEELIKRKSGISIPMILDTYLSYYENSYENHFYTFYNLDEYNATLQNLNAKSRIHKLNRIK